MSTLALLLLLTCLIPILVARCWGPFICRALGGSLIYYDDEVHECKRKFISLSYWKKRLHLEKIKYPGLTLSSICGHPSLAKEFGIRNAYFSDYFVNN